MYYCLFLLIMNNFIRECLHFQIRWRISFLYGKMKTMKKRMFLWMIGTFLFTGCALPASDAVPREASPQAESAEDLPPSALIEDPEAERTEFPDRNPVPEEQQEPSAPEEPVVDPEEASLSSEQAEALAALPDTIFTDSMSEYEKVKAIHDYLVVHVDYDYANLEAGTLPDTAFTVEGALLLHSAVCEGYARAFSYLCRQAGIEEQLVYGTADDGTGVESHAWNQVCVDGNWYNIDVTWDDPMMNGELVTDGSNIIYDYFLVPDLTFLGNHSAEEPDKLHSCTSEQYLEENRQLTIAPYLTEPYAFTATDEEIRAAVEQYLSEGALTFQLVCDLTFSTPESRSDLVLNVVKDTMTAREEYGQISVETQYGVADYAIVFVTITR